MNKNEYLILLNKLNVIENKLDLILNNSTEPFNNEDDLFPDLYGPPTPMEPYKYEEDPVLLYAPRPYFEQNQLNDMVNYLVITEDDRIPEEILRLYPKIIKRSDLEESDIAVRNGIFCNLDSLDEKLYNILKDEKDISIKYYKIYNQVIPNFSFHLDLPYKTYFEGDL